MIHLQTVEKNNSDIKLKAWKNLQNLNIFFFFYTLLALNLVFRWGIQKDIGRSTTRDHMQKTLFRNIITDLGIPKWQYGISELVKVMWSTDKLKGVQWAANKRYTVIQLFGHCAQALIYNSYLQKGVSGNFIHPEILKWHFIEKNH